MLTNDTISAEEARKRCLAYLAEKYHMTPGSLQTFREDIKFPIWDQDLSDLEKTFLPERKGDGPDQVTGWYSFEPGNTICFIDVYIHKTTLDANEAMWEIWYGFLAERLFWVDFVHMAHLLHKLKRNMD